jgi:hypothetical protein
MQREEQLMASYTVTTDKHATLVANTVDTVTLTVQEGGRQIEVLNRGTDYLSVTTNGATPTLLGDDTKVVMPGQAITLGPVSTATVVVKLISASATPYSVSTV